MDGRYDQAHCVPNKQKLNNIYNVLVTEVLFPDSWVTNQIFSAHTHMHTRTSSTSITLRVG